MRYTIRMKDEVMERTNDDNRFSNAVMNNQGM